MKLLIQPDSGIAALLTAIKKAKKFIDIVVFRFDRAELEAALRAAVHRGVSVNALIAYANRGGEKSLRKLEMRMLDAGITVSRTADDLVRYHDKLMVIDRRELYLLSFNFTHLDMDHSLGFPNVIKAGFIVGGRGGRGVASCRTGNSWSSPAFFNLGGGSIGLQIGAQSTDFVLLFMSNDGMNSLLTDSFTLGGDSSVAAGPVGRQAGADTDLKLTSKILSYSRSKGLFAGLELKGVVIKQDKDDISSVYGTGVTAKEVLNGGKVTTPAAVRAFPIMLSRYTTTAAAKK